MGIYFKDFEMPEGCAYCPVEQRVGADFGCGILGFDDANTTCMVHERRKDCPIIFVLPHGDLIDRDFLITRLENQMKENPNLVERNLEFISILKALSPVINK